MFYPTIIDSTHISHEAFLFATSKVVCVGRNYAEHANELNNPIPDEPLLFIKSSNTLVDIEPRIVIPKNQGECHHELEIAVLIGKSLTNASEKEGIASICGIGLALDLTLRDVQQQLKEKKQPWEKAKSFDGACPVTPFIDSHEFVDLSRVLTNLDFQMRKNDQTIQVGNSQDMLFSISTLIMHISRHFSLYPGDIILTGTPAGVGPLHDGDKIQLKLQSQILANCSVA